MAQYCFEWMNGENKIKQKTKKNKIKTKWNKKILFF